jgi:hypothetical protein
MRECVHLDNCLAQRSVKNCAGLPLWLMAGSMTLIGFFTFSTQPSRDILVRGATPPAATGRVCGLVYAGLFPHFDLPLSCPSGR